MCFSQTYSFDDVYENSPEFIRNLAHLLIIITAPNKINTNIISLKIFLTYFTLSLTFDFPVNTFIYYDSNLTFEGSEAICCFYAIIKQLLILPLMWIIYGFNNALLCWCRKIKAEYRTLILLIETFVPISCWTQSMWMYFNKIVRITIFIKSSAGSIWHQWP